MVKLENLLTVKEKLNKKNIAIACGAAVAATLGAVGLVKLYAWNTARKFNEALDDIEEALVDEFAGEEFEIGRDHICGFHASEISQAIVCRQNSGEDVRIFKAYDERSIIKARVDIVTEAGVTQYMDFITDEDRQNDFWDKCTIKGKNVPTIENDLFFMKCSETEWLVILLEGINLTPEMSKDFQESLQGVNAGIMSVYPSIFEGYKTESMKELEELD